jgi:hypothetical protein
MRPGRSWPCGLTDEATTLPQGAGANLPNISSVPFASRANRSSIGTGEKKKEKLQVQCTHHGLSKLPFSYEPPELVESGPRRETIRTARQHPPVAISTGLFICAPSASPGTMCFPVRSFGCRPSAGASQGPAMASSASDVLRDALSSAGRVTSQRGRL